MAVAPGQVLRATIEGVFNNLDIIQNVYHFVNNGSTNAGNAEIMTAIQAFFTALYGNITDETTNLITYNRLIAANANSGNPVGDETMTTPVTGVNITEPAPNQCSGLILLPTSIRKTQGRKFLAGLCEDNIDAGNAVDAAAQVAYADFALDLLDGFTVSGNEFDLVCYRPLDSRVVDVIGAIVRAGIYTQRRRRIGSGV